MNQHLPIHSRDQTLHLVLNELQAAIYSHNSLRLVLLQQYWPHHLVDICVIFQTLKFLRFLAPRPISQIRAPNLLDCFIFLLLRLQPLSRVDIVL